MSPKGHVLKIEFPGCCDLEVREASRGRVQWKVCCSFGKWPWSRSFDPNCFLSSLFFPGSEVRLLLCRIFRPWRAALSQAKSNRSVNQDDQQWTESSKPMSQSKPPCKLSGVFDIPIEMKLTQRYHRVKMKSHNVRASPIEWLVFL